MTPLQRSSHALLCYHLSFLVFTDEELSEFTWEHSYTQCPALKLQKDVGFVGCNYHWRSRFPVGEHVRLILQLLWLHLFSSVVHAYHAPLWCMSRASLNLHAGNGFIALWCHCSWAWCPWQPGHAAGEVVSYRCQDTAYTEDTRVYTVRQMKEYCCSDGLAKWLATSQISKPLWGMATEQWPPLYLASKGTFYSSKERQWILPLASCSHLLPLNYHPSNPLGYENR